MEPPRPSRAPPTGVGEPEIVAALLELGSNVDLCGPKRATALHYAVAGGLGGVTKIGPGPFHKVPYEGTLCSPVVL